MNHLLYTELTDTAPHTFFAGANTGEGFLNDYSVFIDESSLDRLYILKGGSGCGKSTLLKAAAAAAPPGSAVTTLLCGSDPYSADAVRIDTPGGRKIALLDGTAPHTTDPALPGAGGKILYLGAYWDDTFLMRQRQEIAHHVQKKREAYRCAYQFLHAAQNATDAHDAILRECLFEEKMQRAVERLTTCFREDGVPRFSRRLTSAISMRGAYRIPVEKLSAKKRFCILDVHESGTFFLQAVHRLATARQSDGWYSPILPHTERPGEIFLRHSKTVFYLDQKRIPEHEHMTENASVTYVNMARFLNRTQIAANRMKLRFFARCNISFMEGALESLHEAQTHHFALEEIYRAAMDFHGVQQETDRLCQTIAQLDMSAGEY